jgi:hypothetical protein
MNVRRIGGTTVIVCAVVLALTMQVAGAATNLIGNRSFEVPAVPLDDYATFPTGSTLGTCGLAMPGSIGYQTGCWRVFGGNVDVVQNEYWNAKNGSQSIELNGTGPGEVLQLFAAQPNHTYHVKFSLSGDPFVAGTVSLLVVQEQFDSAGNYITGAVVGSYGFDTTGHSTTSMGYTTATGTFTTSANAAYDDIEFQSLTNSGSYPWWGPVIDQVTLK